MARIRDLSAYDEAFENNRRRMRLLEKAARLLYEEWFVRLRFPGHERTPITNRLPQGWERKQLVEMCPDLREAANPTELEAGTPYIGLEHMPRRSVTLSDWGNAEEVTSTKLRYVAGDILFGKIRPYFHKVGFALTEGVTSSDAIVLRPIDPIFYSFSLLTVSSDWFVRVVSKTAKEGSKMPRADWNLMESRISKLWLQKHFTHRQVAAFERGWDVHPTTDAAKRIVDLLAAGLAETVFGK